MGKDLTVGYDVVAHFSQNAVERIFQSYYLAGEFPNYVSAPFSQGGVNHTIEIFYGLPRLRFVSVPGVDNVIRFTFDYLVRLTNYDQEWPGQTSVVIAATPLTMPTADGKFLTALGINLDNVGLGEFTFGTAQYPEFDTIVRPLMVASILGTGRRCVVFAAGVAGVGAGDGVAEAAFDPGEGGVAQPVGADLLGGYPGQVLADAQPQVVVAAVGDRSA